MPTTRPLYMINETDDLAAALDVAATRWPELSRPQLLVRLALAAAEPLNAEQRRERRLAALGGLPPVSTPTRRAIWLSSAWTGQRDRP